MKIGDLFNLTQMCKDLENEQELQKDKEAFENRNRGE